LKARREARNNYLRERRKERARLRRGTSTTWSPPASPTPPPRSVGVGRDEFLQECQAPDPHKMLESARSAIKQHANTDKVFAVAIYKQASKWSRVINMETFGLLRDIVTLAKNQDTGRIVKQGRELGIVGIVVAVLVLLVGLAAALSK